MNGRPTAPQARELTQAEVDHLVHEAFACERRIKATIADIHTGYWMLAEQLHALHEMRGWTLLGFETLNEFLAQPEVGMSRSGYFRAVKAWRDLVEVKRVKPERLLGVEPSKVQEILPAVMSGNVNVDVALDDCSALGFRDLREKYRSRGAATLPAPDTTTEVVKATVTVSIDVLAVNGEVDESRFRSAVGSGEGVIEQIEVER